MILKELQWDRSTFQFSCPHHFANIKPRSYVDPQSRLDQQWCIRHYMSSFW